jgi:excisionase family DNA binding protein
MSSTPLDLLPVRDAARLVGRGYSTVRAWIAAGQLEAHRGEGTHRGSPPVLVSRAELLLLCATSKSTDPGRRPPAEPPAVAPGAAVELAELRAAVAVARAERDGLAAVVEAQRGTVAALDARARDLAAALEVERATVGGLRAELEALRQAAGLPWWRRLLGAPKPPELTRDGEA